VTVAVPDVKATSAFYREFGLVERAPGRLASAVGGEQLRLVAAPSRRLVELGVGVDDPDDLARATEVARSQGREVLRGTDTVAFEEPASEVRVLVRIAPRHPGSDAPNRDPIPASRRTNRRAPPLERTEPVHPRKLGHVVIGSPDALRTRATFEALGFKVSDEIKDLAVFLRCSTDHHNLLIQRAPVPFLHHTSWQVADVDEIGRGAKAMLDVDPTRHTWGLGRHFVGSNFFWYLRDPAGNFAEYYADMDVIVDDQLWQPGVFSDERALYAWGPPPPASFIVPDDLADLMAR
jgi:catechol 2,3-dioxygenase-like lactoylglutathione lyase family enzyme